MNSRTSWHKTVPYILLLAVLYYVAGYLGLQTAVPPGYATFIWPASGIALGMLVVYGARLWPGIVLGSFFLNWIDFDTLFQEGPDFERAVVALCIASGSTIQALTGKFMIKKFMGLPLELRDIKDTFKLFFIAGPFVCLIAATISVPVITYFNPISLSTAWHNWITWWTGDTLGVLIFFPLVLLLPSSTHKFIWKGRILNDLPVLTMIVMVIPLGLTLYMWKISHQYIYEKSWSNFESITQESEKALLHQMDSYQQALLGISGFIKGSTSITEQEWKNYYRSLNISENVRGMKSIGYIANVPSAKIKNFVAQQKKINGESFNVHPPVDFEEYFIVTHVEPKDPQKRALGLNISFEKSRYDTALLSRDTGKAVITGKIKLVTEDSDKPAFLIMNPVYSDSNNLMTPDDRREALLGWVYASLIGENILKELDRGPNGAFSLSVYDGEDANPDSLIYTSETGDGKDPATFEIRRKIEVMQRKWTLVALTRDMALFLVSKYGVAVDAAVHAPQEAKGDDPRNHHAHLLFLTRVVQQDGLGEKTRILDDKEQGPQQIELIRQVWETLANAALQQAGFEGVRIDRRTLEDQGIDRIPQEHIGKAGTHGEAPADDEEERRKNEEDEDGETDTDKGKVGSGDKSLTPSAAKKDSSPSKGKEATQKERPQTRLTLNEEIKQLNVQRAAFSPIPLKDQIKELDRLMNRLDARVQRLKTLSDKASLPERLSKAIVSLFHKTKELFTVRTKDEAVRTLCCIKTFKRSCDVEN